MNKSSGAQKNDVNAHIVLPRTHCSARCMHLNSWHLLQAIPNVSYCMFHLSKLYVYQARLCLQISYPAILFTANGIFKLWEFYHSRLFAGKKESVHIPSFAADTQQNVANSTEVWECLWEKVWNNLKCLKRCAFQCILTALEFWKWGFVKSKKSEIRLKSDLSHPWL